MADRVNTYINDCAVVSALGVTRQANLASLLAGSQAGMQPYDNLISGKTTFVGRVDVDASVVPSALAHWDCRNNQLVTMAYDQIAPTVARLRQRVGAERIAVVLGTSTSGIASSEHAHYYKEQHGRFPNDFCYRVQEAGTLAHYVSELAGTKGVTLVVSTACSSSAKAIAEGARLLKADICDAVIVGGADSLCEMTVNGFDTLELVSNALANPFSTNRNGLNIGEGAALFVLSREPSRVRLAGYGETSDAYHVSSPDPSGEGAKRAMQAALTMAQCAPHEVGYLNCHGTATLLNDAMEARAIDSVFGSTVLVSSTKPLTGHTLGAAAAIELALCWLLLSRESGEQSLMPHRYDGHYDPSIPHLTLTTPKSRYTRAVMMSNSFAFGGSNASLLIERHDD